MHHFTTLIDASTLSEHLSRDDLTLFDCRFDLGNTQWGEAEYGRAHLPGALYLHFNYGTISSGRTLKAFRLLLEANLMIYAQDQAQLGMDAETGGIVMIVRVEFGDDVGGDWLCELLAHYAEHGRYWRDNIFQMNDDMFEQVANGSYLWIKA